jgi:AraC-like DNA-binding protein
MREPVDNSLAWLAPLRGHFKLSTSSATPVGTLAACEAGSLQVMQLSGVAYRLRLEQLAGRPVWVVGIIQRDGAAILEQGAASPALLPEGMVLLSSVAPFEVEFAVEQPACQTWLLLPAETVRDICPELALDTPRVVHCAGLHVEMLKAAADLLQRGPAPRLLKAGQHVASAVAYLLAAAVAAQGQPAEPARTSLAKYHLSRIKQFVLANLQDPELTVGKVSARLKISPSHIHRIFGNEHQTFAEWLWDQRLAACKEALEKSADTKLSISQIAFSHGFSNSSHFSRTFKARFGMSPSEARRSQHKKSRSGL